MKKITVEDIFAGVSVVLGRTGGKGVFISSYQEGLKSQGVDLIKLASGDCFREAARTNKTLSERMSKGKLIEDHDEIIEPLKAKIREYLISLSEGRNVELVLDGFERLGSDYIYQEKLGKKGQKAESQITQIANAFREVCRELCATNPSLFHETLRSTLIQETPYPIYNGEAFIGVPADNIFIEAYSNTRRYLVNTTHQDSESFQRARSVGTLREVIEEFENTNLSGLAGNITVQLKRIKALQEGRFTVRYREDKETGRKIQEVQVDFDREPRTLTHCMRGVSTSAYDKAMLYEIRILGRSIGKVLKEEGVVEPNEIKDQLLRVCPKLGLKGIPGEIERKIKAFRADDLTLSSRKQRETLFSTETQPMMKKELGYMPTDSKGVVWKRKGTGKDFINGPELGVGLEQFKAVAFTEGVLVGESQRNRTTEGLVKSPERVY